MDKRFYENSKWAVMDFETFSKLNAHSIDKTIKKNAKKRTAKNG